MESLQSMLEVVILNLPNFAGLIIALVVIGRQNSELTKALIDMTKHCVEEIGDLEK